MILGRNKAGKVGQKAEVNEAQGKKARGLSCPESVSGGLGGHYTKVFDKGETLKKLEQAEFEALVHRAEVLESDAYGPKIFRLCDGSMLKMFRLKRWFSSALLFPYSRRFVRNCRRLKSLRVPCPEITMLYCVPHLSREALLYRPLAGETLRSLIRNGVNADVARTMRIELADFINRLHASGVLFRSLHLGNIVRTPSGAYGLIDVADMVIFFHPLFSWQRTRNFGHLTRYTEDAVWLDADGGFVGLCASRRGSLD